jgi:putative aldouronate transport system permease protein
MMKKDGFGEEIKKNKVLFLMLLPAVIYFVVFSYLPMAGIVIAFQRFNYNKFFLFNPWVGFDNFKFLFASGKAWLLTKNTVLYNLAFISTGIAIQVTIAIIFSELKGKYYKKISQSLMFLPYFISWVVVGAFVYNMFQYEFGTLNSILKSLNMQPVDVYGNPSAWKYILVSFNLWKYAGYGSIVYLAAIMGINPELFESAEIDGANIFHRICYITLPLIKPTIIILVLLQIGGIMRGNFDLFYQIIGNNGLLFNATDVIDTYVFRTLTTSLELGMPAAAGLYQQAIGFAIIMTANYIVKRVNEDYALF